MSKGGELAPNPLRSILLEGACHTVGSTWIRIVALWDDKSGTWMIIGIQFDLVLWNPRLSGSLQDGPLAVTVQIGVI